MDLGCGGCFQHIYVVSDFRNGSDNIATLLMWGVYLGNAIIMLIKWEKEARQKNAI